MTPEKYIEWFNELPFQTISFGYGGLELYQPSELNELQVGYSRSPQGKSLCDGKAGSWNTNWLVIGTDTLIGDPVIMDIGNPDFPIMIAMHGEGVWRSRLIATSLSVFGVALKAVQKLSAGRENPVKLEQNPLPAEEREQALKEIQRENNREIDMEFWALLLET